jgi:hypothetical protein
VQPAGQLKVSVPDSAGRLEHLQQFFAFQHFGPANRVQVLSVEMSGD